MAEAGNINGIEEMITRINPEVSNEVVLIKSYINTCDMIDGDLINDYSVSFRYAVFSSDIPVDAKEMLQTAIGVGVGSNELWLIE